MENLNSFIKEKISLWKKLESTSLPIILYGMGDGAVKLLSILNKRNIRVSGIFASDEFARYNEFCSFTVKKLQDIEKEFEEFIILTAFASRLDEVCDRIFSLADRHELYVPDINVVRDPNEVFDEEFYGKNYNRLERVFSALSDNRSREVFTTLINYKLSGKVEYLKRLEELRLQEAPLYDREKIHTFADFGAYTGDTITEALSLYPNIKRACGFEPDKKTFKKLEKNVSALSCHIEIFNAAAHSSNRELELFEGAGRNTVLKGCANINHALQKKNERVVTALRADTAISFIPDLIKLDVEGSEVEALEGCRTFFENSRPIVRASIYHNNRDLFEIFEKLESLKKGYKLSLSQKCRYIPAWDIELVAY